MIPINQPQKAFTPETVSVRSGKPEDQDIVVYDNTKVFIRDSQVHGIGVFANKSIKKDEAVEVFPIVPMSFRTNYQGDTRVLEYGVVKFCECEECKRHGYVIFLRLGYGGIYNHQDDHNAMITIDYGKFYGTCVAIKDIEQGDEIFINYGSQYSFKDGKNNIRE